MKVDVGEVYSDPCKMWDNFLLCLRESISLGYNCFCYSSCHQKRLCCLCEKQKEQDEEGDKDVLVGRK